MIKKILISGTLLSGLAVIIGAFGAHQLQDLLELNGTTETYKTAVLYHMFHSLALILLGLLVERGFVKNAKGTFALLLTGILLFSGSLYALAITNFKLLGIITPFGGLAFIAAWVLISINIFKK